MTSLSDVEISCGPHLKLYLGYGMSSHRCEMPNSDVSRLLHASPRWLKIRMPVGNETKRDAERGRGDMMA